MNQLNNNFSQNRESLLFEGYQINSKGEINFPVLGKIKVVDLTVYEVRNLIYNMIKEREILVEPSVEVKHINAHFIALGEFNNPGKHSFLQNNLNLLEAISIAGDLTIYGKRNDIKIVRFKNGEELVKSVDLTSKSFLNDNFQIISGDVILVNQNQTRIKNAGIIGNSGTLLSLLSFLLSSIILLSNQ